MKRRVGARLESRAADQATAEAEDVAHVVTGVGQQRHRIAEQAEDHLQNHEARVEGDPDGERPSKARGRVGVAWLS